MNEAVSQTLSVGAGPSDKPLLDDTIGHAFDRTAAQFPDNPGLIVSHQGIRWTYAEYQREVDRLATGLLALGIQPGDRVGIWAPNCAEWCLTQFAYYKAPGYVAFVDALPVTATNKLNRGKLADLVKELHGTGDALDTRYLKKRDAS